MAENQAGGEPARERCSGHKFKNDEAQEPVLPDKQYEIHEAP